jgi:hypothetical protein
MRVINPLLMIGLLLLVAAPGNAEFVTLTSANSTVKIDPSSTSGVFDWLVDGVDQLYQEWFWFRIGDTGGESGVNAISEPEVVQAQNNVAEITYQNQDMKMSILFTLGGGGLGSGASDLAELITITNLRSVSPLDLHFFEYTDFDLNGAVSGQSVALSGVPTPNTAFQSGSGDIVSETVATPRPAHWAAASYNSTLASLMDSSPTTLGNSWSAGPGDVTWAFQWDKAVSGTFQISKDKNIAAVVPEPATILGLGTVLFLVGSRLRRKRA